MDDIDSIPGQAASAPALDGYAAELGDWRCATAFWITAIDGLAIEPKAAHQVTTLTTASRHTSFVTPSATALHLNSAWRAAKSAVQLKTQLKWVSGRIAPGVFGDQIGVENTSAVFDYLEQSMSAAISAYAAIEAFCNSVIVERSTGPLTVKIRNGVDTLSPEEVERRVSTDEKLKRIVPDLLGYPTPAGKAVWQRYVKLKKLRDSVTHFKRKDQARHAAQLNEPTALHELITADPPSFPEIATAVIEYFFIGGAIPRWMMNPAWSRAAP
jgi:hypothetical protein